MSGLFGTFNVAKRGLFVQQKAIDVTSHNIANANTEGYSRQRAMMETTTPFPMPSINNAAGPGQLGTGAQISIIQRVRDEFLDFQVRNESSTMGMYEARDRFLSEIESVYNEPSDTGLSTSFGKFFDAWQEFTKQSETSNARTVVAQQAKALTNDLNHTYNQLQKVKTNAQNIIKDTVYQVNNMLNQIDTLNQQIMKVKVSGLEPNDLMDKRDLLMDKLSSELNIDLKNRNFATQDLRPGDIENVPDGGEPLLVRKEPNYAVSRFSYVSNIEEVKNSKGDVTSLKINYFKKGDNNKTGTIEVIKSPKGSVFNKNEVNSIKRNIEECKVIWASEDGTAYSDGVIAISNVSEIDQKLGLFKPSSGALQGYMSVQKDVDDYVDRIDKLAKALTFAVNAIHTGSTDGTKNPEVENTNFFVNSEDSTDEASITAGNISVNKDILDNVMKINAGATKDSGENDSKRAIAIAMLRDALFKVQDIDLENANRKSFIDNLTGGFSLNTELGIKTIQSNVGGMTLDNYFKDMVDTLGIQEEEAKRIVKNQDKLLSDFDQRRTSVSGVSMDEEMANLIQFQHAYGANAKIISTVDELLDVVVNGLKR
ncbi:flagellar hook-associated protein FlgK [Haloimpatiens sp. FM7315]|uniref:flagellar hook-associated protein FlgK n=1 Tax=Haloimpatiens sp. FM7315 TaxID=3298609 RepID=UPI00370C7D93